MSAFPILFSGAMVRALLSHSKTRTRRIVDLGDRPEDQCSRHDEIDRWAFDGERWHAGTTVHGGNVATMATLRCRYGKPGDRLWVRETHAIFDMDWRPCTAKELDGGTGHAIYQATEPRTDVKWSPSIHMPRWASRISLGVDVVRIERLQDITEEEAAAEGMIGHINGWQAPGAQGYHVGMFPTAREAFAFVWDALNRDRAAWKSNPWVWVVGFHPIHGVRP